MQDREILNRKRNDLIRYLEIKELEFLTAYFLEAYDYFIKHPNQYDGASFIKDLEDLPELSLSAMRHDFDYIINLPKYKGCKWLRKKIQFDWNYGKNLEKLGKGVSIPYLRVFGLWAITPLYWLCVKIRH